MLGSGGGVGGSVGVGGGGSTPVGAVKRIDRSV